MVVNITKATSINIAGYLSQLVEPLPLHQWATHYFLLAHIQITLSIVQTFVKRESRERDDREDKKLIA